MTAVLAHRLAVPVLADLLPGRLARDAVLVGGGAALIGLSAQVTLPLPGTPVPLTLQTLAVLMAGAALGARRGAAATMLYLILGAIGVPWFAGHAAGWGGPAFGYVIGFVAAATVAGWLAHRGADRSPLSAAGALMLADATIYLVGIPWLMLSTGYSLTRAIALGLAPFLLGDAVKVAIAAAALPVAWKLTETAAGRRDPIPETDHSLRGGGRERRAS